MQRGGALAAVASEELDDGEVAGNKITFEAEAKFRDNSFEVRLSGRNRLDEMRGKDSL